MTSSLSGLLASRRRTARLVYVLFAAALATSRAASAQVAPAATCSFRACALVISPRWNGLALVRGPHGPQVANLNFFWPRDLSAALASAQQAFGPSADSSLAEARRAVHVRRIGAVLTDGAAVLGAVALVRAARAGRFRRSDGVIAAASVAALGVSIPVHFAADGALSRAVWWQNSGYAP